MNDKRRFPIMGDQIIVGWGSNNLRLVNRPGFTVSWAAAEIAYEVYSAKYGTQQSLERIAERGGFGRGEFLWLLSGGRNEDLNGSQFYDGTGNV